MRRGQDVQIEVVDRFGRCFINCHRGTHSKANLSIHPAPNIQTKKKYSETPMDEQVRINMSIEIVLKVLLLKLKIVSSTIEPRIFGKA